MHTLLVFVDKHIFLDVSGASVQERALVAAETVAFVVLLLPHAVFQLLLARGHHLKLLVIARLLGQRLVGLHTIT